MHRTIPTRTLLAMVALVLSSAAAPAEWPQDIFSPLPLCETSEAQFSPAIVEDGQERYIVVWLDYRDDPAVQNLYAQCFDADGIPQWDVNGELVVSAYWSVSDYPRLVADGQGGAYVVFVDAPSGYYYEVLAQHIDADGSTTWNNPINLIPEEEEISARINPCAVSDGSGGVIVGMEDHRIPGQPDIWAQRIDLNGNLLWGDQGAPVCENSDPQRKPVAVSDENGGAIFAWIDERNYGVSGDDLFMQHLDSEGANLWINDGNSLCNSLNTQWNLVAEPDGFGGALFAWTDLRNGNQDVFADRIEPMYGYSWWSGIGVSVCENAEAQNSPVIISDGHGGAFVAWIDDRDDGWESTDIYAQHMSNAGSLLWSSYGLAAAGINSYQGYYGIDLAPDSHDGVIIVWSGTIGTGGYSTDLIGQRFSSEGSRYWDYYGQFLCQQNGNQNHPVVAPHADGGVVMAFQSSPNLIDADIYYSYIDEFGYPGDVGPEITSVMDFPADQGGVVILSWARSYRDNPAQGIDDYTVWKRLHLEVAGAADPSEYEHALSSGLPEWKVDELLRTGWTYVDAIDAAWQEEYAYDAPTYGDATDEETIYTDYKVIARESEWVFWESEVAMGFSEDNLAPGAPLNLAALVEVDDVTLHWSPSGHHDEDLALYRLYRGDSPGFTPDAGSFLSSSADTAFVDVDPGAGLWFYLVTAQDLHGNEGEQSNEAMAELITAVEDGGTPTIFAMRGNWPNPFNPKTSIGFDLPSAGRVRLDIFDSTGRRVATLLDEHLAAGSYHELWRGLDEAGRPVASGVYLAKVRFGDETASHRMLLLK